MRELPACYCMAWLTLLDTIKSRARHTAWKASKKGNSWNPWARRIPHTGDFFYDEENPRSSISHSPAHSEACAANSIGLETSNNEGPVHAATAPPPETITQPKESTGSEETRPRHNQDEALAKEGNSDFQLTSPNILGEAEDAAIATSSAVQSGQQALQHVEPFSDSGYASAPQHQAPPAQLLSCYEEDEVASQYTQESIVSKTTRDLYINDLTILLASSIDGRSLDLSLVGIDGSADLGSILRSFALRVGHEGFSKLHVETRNFVRRYRL